MASCDSCKFGTVKDGPIILCRRFPALAKVAPAHWCGEHQELAREPEPAPAPPPAKAALLRSSRRAATQN